MEICLKIGVIYSIQEVRSCFLLKSARIDRPQKSVIDRNQVKEAFFRQGPCRRFCLKAPPRTGKTFQVDIIIRHDFNDFQDIGKHV